MMAIDLTATTEAAINSNNNIIKRSHRRRKRPLERNEINSLVCVASLTALYVFFLYQTASVIETIEDSSSRNFRFHGFLHDNRKNIPASDNHTNFRTQNKRSGKDDEAKNQVVSTDGPTKYLIFVGQLSGQGTGNIISGLLSAHLFGEEFNRVVCVQDYPTFTDLFDLADPVTMSKCPSILPSKFPPTNYQHHISLINFASPPDECALQDKLNSDEPVLFMTGNTYPRWPTVPDNFFFKYYKAKPKLLEALPYDPQSPPSTVVHLREPDGVGDSRKGLDDVSLTALGNLLPHGPATYLVTNNVAYYQRFEECCKWSHPQWETVRHSAFAQEWGPNQHHGISLSSAEVKAQQNVQMWADWYTMLTAKTIYHTHSDFSISAIHWTNKIDSHNLQGMQSDGRTLKTVRESWWVDGETTPLSQRTRTAQGKDQLRLCK